MLFVDLLMGFILFALFSIATASAFFIGGLFGVAFGVSPILVGSLAAFAAAAYLVKDVFLD